MIRILILGDPQVGKTSLVSRLCNKPPTRQYIPTQGIDYNYKVISSNDQKVLIQMWDMPGKDQYNPAIKLYYERATAFLIVFSLNDYSSFENVESWIGEIRNRGAPEASVVLVGNKSDVVGREVSSEEIQNISKKYNLPYFEVSAWENTGCSSVLRELVENSSENKNDKILQEILAELDENTQKDIRSVSKIKIPSQSEEETKNSSPLAPLNNNFVKSSKEKTYIRGDEEWKKELKRIESRFEEEFERMKRDFSKMLEKEPGRIKERKSEPFEKKTKMRINYYESFESFQESIVEEVIQSRLKTQIALDSLAEEIKTLKHRLSPVEKNNIGSPYDINVSTRDSLTPKEPALIIEKFDDSIKKLFDETDTIKRRTAENEEKIKEIFLFVEKELRLAESNVRLELEQRIDEMTQKYLFRNEPTIEESELGEDYDKMVKDLNESIRKCIIDTEDIYNNIKQGIGTKIEATNNASGNKEILKIQSQLDEYEDNQNNFPPIEDPNEAITPIPQMKSPRRFAGDLYKLANKENFVPVTSKVFANTESVLHSSLLETIDKMDLSPYRVKRIMSERDYLKSFRPHKIKPYQYQEKESFYNIVTSEKFNNSSSKSEVNDDPYEEQDEIGKIWGTINGIVRNTNDEIAKIWTHIRVYKKLDVTGEGLEKNDLLAQDIKEIVKDVKDEVHDQIIKLQRECEAMFVWLKDTVLNNYNTIFENLNSTKNGLEEHIKSIYNELKSQLEDHGKLLEGNALSKIERLASEIQMQGMMSPTEDFSVIEFKVEKKNVHPLEEDKTPKGDIKRLEKQQADLNCFIKEFNESVWATLELMAKRLENLEDGIRRHNCSLLKLKDILSKKEI